MVEKIPRAPRKAPSKISPGSSSGLREERSADIGDHIGNQLKAIYDEVVAQPIPERLLDLLNRLAAKDGEK